MMPVGFIQGQRVRIAAVPDMHGTWHEVQRKPLKQCVVLSTIETRRPWQEKNNNSILVNIEAYPA